MEDVCIWGGTYNFFYRSSKNREKAEAQLQQTHCLGRTPIFGNGMGSVYWTSPACVKFL